MLLLLLLLELSFYGSIGYSMLESSSMGLLLNYKSKTSYYKRAVSILRVPKNTVYIRY